MFLHAGLLHLASNSIYLYYFGVRAERLLGTGKFLVLYLVFGALRRRVQCVVQRQCRRFYRRIGGNLWSAWRNAPAHQKARRTLYGHELFYHASSGGNGDWVRLFAGGWITSHISAVFWAVLRCFPCFCAKNEQSCGQAYG